MKHRIGIWVDHREAILVKLTESGDETVHIKSGAESQPRRSSDHENGTFEPLNVPADDTRERKFMAELNTYYDDVISHLGHAQSILIIGPGEARTELKKRIEGKRIAVGNITLEPADKMSHAQVAAKTHKHFQLV